MLRAARPQIARYAARYCVAQLAEDATQEALWTLYRKLPTLRSVAAFPVWLIRIVARICSGLVTPLWRRIEALQEEHWTAQPDDVELHLDLARAIEALPETYREALVLFYYCDLSIAETAGRLGIANAAARVRLHRGRELIRRRLTGESSDCSAPDPMPGPEISS